MPIHCGYSLLICFVSFGCSQSVPPGPVVLGHLKPPQSDDEVQGIALAVEPINASESKRVLGRKLKVIHADAGTTADDAQGQTVRLLTVDKVEGLIGCSQWPQVEKMALAAQSPLTLAVSLNGYAGSPPSACLFPVGIAPAEQGHALARYVKESMKGSKAILLKEADALIPEIIAKAFAEQFDNTSEHTIKSGEAPDFLKDLGSAKPDAIVLCGSAKTVLAWQAKLPNAVLLFGGAEAEVAVLQAESDVLKPMIAAVSFHFTDETPVAKDFVRQFQEKYGKPPSLASALAFDALNVWAEAARRANSIQADKIREQLTKPNAAFDVLTGSLSYGVNQTPKRAIFIVKLGADVIKKLERIEP